MAWFSGKVNLGNFPDLAGAVNKLSESVKSIEKNFDTALGFDEKSSVSGSSGEASGLWPSAPDRKALFEPIMGFIGQKDEEAVTESLEEPSNDSSVNKASAEISDVKESIQEKILVDAEQRTEEKTYDGSEEPGGAAVIHSETEEVAPSIFVEASAQKPLQVEQRGSAENLPEEDGSVEATPAALESIKPEPSIHKDQVEVPPVVEDTISLPEAVDKHEEEEDTTKDFPIQAQDLSPHGRDDARESSTPDYPHGDADDNSVDNLPTLQNNNMEVMGIASNVVTHPDDAISHPIDPKKQSDDDSNVKGEDLNIIRNTYANTDSAAELEKLKKEMKMMETALLGAAKQAQAKADEIAKLMSENEHLKALIEDLRRKSNEAEIESIREEYHQRVAALERKVYSLTKERDTLRREQSKKSDAAALLKEKDEIINQVMAEGEELSKKQAAQESQMRKLRAQIRELEEEKKGLLTKLQVEENKVQSIKRDKAATEKLLQETVEKHQDELTAQKEYYTNALNAAKEAEALAEARPNTEARTELESRLREAEDRESMLVQTLEELRQTLSRKEQQAVFREDMLRRDIEDLQKRYQESERRCEELISQVPDSTRPLLRQIEAMQETAARKAEAWVVVERSLNSRLQEAEAKAAASEEKERSINERLTQTLSRINVLEAQISCLRAEQTQLTKSLEKERQRAAENRQEYLALKEEAETQECRVHQLDEEIRELKKKHKEELQEARMLQELLQQELEREKVARLEQEKAALLQSSVAPDESPLTRHKSASFENGSARKLSTASSVSSMEESYFLQTTLDSSENLSEHRSVAEGTLSPYYMRSVTSNTFEAALRQKEGELASYMSRLASLESIRDSLAEELVKMTAQCEKLRTEAAELPGIRAELESLRRRHSAALELMGERDEELEELRADIVDMKEMYREQVNLLVNKIQILSTSMGAT